MKTLRNGSSVVAKASDIQSKVSALFEAFEHYISYVTFHNEKRAIQLRVGRES